MSDTETKLAWSRGNAPAWQVRDMQRQKLLENIQHHLSNVENEFEQGSDVHRLVMELVSGKLATGSLGMSLSGTLPSIPWKKRNLVYRLVLSADASIDDFKRSYEEGLFLWAKVLEWSTGQFTHSFHAALHSQETLEPQKVYGTEHSMQEVPIPD